MSVRKPPLPQYFYRHRSGQCRWCGGDIEPRLKRDGQPHKQQPTFHPDCLAEWKVVAFPDIMRRRVWDRDHGICAHCGLNTDALENRKLVVGRRDVFSVSDGRGDMWPRCRFSAVRWEADWFADHIVPLWSVDRGQPNAIRFWQLGNIQTLCRDCHAAKTAKEAGDRAQSRRAATEPAFL